MKLRKWKETLFHCTDEMREDFMMAMKKAIVDFVLKDPNAVRYCHLRNLLCIIRFPFDRCTLADAAYNLETGRQIPDGSK